MPKIDFYILAETTAAARLNYVCRLVEKAHQQEHRVYVHTESDKDAFLIDELLWTYKEDSFIPHNLVGEGPNPPPAIQIGFSVPTAHQKDILINLTATVPEFHTQFQRIIEVIIEDAEITASGRERYKFYREKGYEIKTHKLQTIEA
jgi:DNA polymerase-3 subunit chi